MKKPLLLEHALCSRFCLYYKPGKTESISCRGFKVVERILHEGKDLDLEKAGRQSNPRIVEVLVTRMCMTCDFHEQDCDFMQDRNKQPCGGFLLLEQLLIAGSILSEDVR